MAGDISVISSRNRVPPDAASIRPLFIVVAPVKAPFSWPKSSLASSLEGSATQFTFTKGFRALKLL